MNLSVKDLLIKNNLFKIEYLYTSFHYSIKPNSRIRFNLSTQLNSNHNIISNPTIIFELDQESYLEFDYENIFDSISLEIGGSEIDRIYNKIILIKNKINGFDIIKNRSKILFQLPFEIMNNGEGILVSMCKYHDIAINVIFNSNQFINSIKNCCIKTELTIVENKLDYPFMNNYYELEFCKCYYDKIINISPKKIITKFYRNQFFELINLSGSINSRIKLDFYNIINRFFIFFQNPDDYSIYCNTQQFELIRFIANDHVILEYNYTTLQYLNSKIILGYEMSKGVFEIKWNICKEFKNLSKIDNLFIELVGLMVPKKVSFGICAESINYLCYENNMCEAYFSN